MYENINYEVILDRMLDRIPDTMDKREGSVIYDALAPAAIELQLMYIELDNIINESFADTASREFLIKRAAERGIAPEQAKNARVKGIFTPGTLNIPIGSRFNLGVINYIITAKISDGVYNLDCETAGIAGNITGTLIPIEEITGLDTAEIIATLIPGEDEEDTEAFRRRYFDSFELQSFGGNIADYKVKVNAMDGVGECKVYPAWQGGGTVKVVIMNSQFGKPTQVLIDQVQSALDPTLNHGQGVGLAPIGHVVTVAGVIEKIINITTIITFVNGSTLDTAINSVSAAVDKYFLLLKQAWQDTEKIVVRISQIEYNLLNCSEILDVSDTKINGSSVNLLLETDGIPVRGTINGK